MNTLEPGLRDNLLMAVGLINGAAGDITNTFVAAAVRVAADLVRDVYDATADQTADIHPFPGHSVKA